MKLSCSKNLQYAGKKLTIIALALLMVVSVLSNALPSARAALEAGQPAVSAGDAVNTDDKAVSSGDAKDEGNVLVSSGDAKDNVLVSAGDVSPSDVMLLADEPLAEGLELQITFTTNKPVGSELMLFHHFYSGSYMLIDWGDGNLVQYGSEDELNTHREILGITAGNTIKVYSSGPSDMIVYTDCGITDVDVAPNPRLGNLNLTNNALTELDTAAAPNLRELLVGGNALTELDTSANPELGRVFCDGNNLTELDLSANPKLEVLNCGDNAITDLEISNNPELRELDCGNNNLAQLDVSANPKLEILDCGYNALTELDLSANHELKEVYCQHNGLTELDLSASTGLKILECDHNSLTELDVSSCAGLSALACSNNALTEDNFKLPDDLSSLRGLIISDNNIASIDLSTATNLESLAAHNTRLSALDVSGMTALHSLTCDNTNISALDLSKSQGMGMIMLLSFENTNVSDLKLPSTVPVVLFNGDNASLMFSDLPDPALMDSAAAMLPEEYVQTIIDTMGAEYGVSMTKLFEYAPQAKVKIPDEIESDDVIDLSSEYEVYGKNTVYKWFDGTTEVTPTTSEGGKFTFGPEFGGKKLRCEMTNENYPDLTLETTEVEIAETLELKITFTTNKPVGSTLEFNPVLAAGFIVYVDWGDGNIVPYQNGHVTNIVVSGETKGNTVKIYCENDILFFYCPDCGITDIDLSKNPGINAVDCNNNALAELDLSGCSELRRINCNNNAITDIELPADCSKLETFQCYNNQLEELVFPADALALEVVECPNNKLTRLELPENLTTLWSFACDNNQLTELELPDNLSALEMFSICHNDISSIDLSTATNLTMLMAHNTKLSTLDVSGMQNLYALTCDNTDISALDLSNAKGMSGMIVILSFENTNVSDLNLPSTVPVAIFNGDNARLMFSDLPDPAVMESIGSSLPDGFIDSVLEGMGTEVGISVSKNFEYAPQAKVKITDEIDFDDVIDLSSEYEVYGENTVYKWFDGTTEVTPTTSEGGKFTFGPELGGKKLRCEMTNENYPDLTLETTEVLVNGPETGALTISSTVTGEGAPADAEFVYTVTFDSTESYPYTGSAAGTIKSGDKLTLKAGESVTISDIVVGVKYTVTQDAAENFVTTPASGKAEGTVSTTPAVAAFSNAYNPPVTTGTLTITNKVTGSDVDTTLKFPFKVEFDAAGSYELRVYGAGETVPAAGSTGMLGRITLSAAGSRATTSTIKSGDTIQLAHGETAVIYGLPAGTTYKVTETDTKGYKLTSTGASGTVSQDGAKASFINEKNKASTGDNKVPDTGDYGTTDAAALAVMHIALLAALLFVFCMNKLRENSEAETR